MPVHYTSPTVLFIALQKDQQMRILFYIFYYCRNKEWRSRPGCWLLFAPAAAAAAQFAASPSAAIRSLNKMWIKYLLSLSLFRAWWWLLQSYVHTQLHCGWTDQPEMDIGRLFECLHYSVKRNIFFYSSSSTSFLCIVSVLTGQLYIQAGIGIAIGNL